MSSDLNVTSSEQLDELLGSGKISQQEYDTLRTAMDAEPGNDTRSYRRGRQLCKSRKNRLMEGVCAGIAGRIGTDPWRVRAAFVVAFILSAGLALLVYVVLALVLPWDSVDEPSGISAPMRSYWMFAAAVGSFWMLYVAFGVLFVPQIMGILEHSEAALPTATLYAVWLADVFFGSPLGYLLQLVVFGVLVGVYVVIPEERSVRLIYAIAVCAALLILLCVLVAALYLPVHSISATIR